ncbi:MAG: hypothetical protein JXR48_03840 [Candidatus Delongbacteria bacterium]|nr:hypothetical protein [Candidatus Delongbacteria bacterium]MBN2834078.1 hypothetical protein [Candidatus Delongbacteria bacterium]
MIFLTLTIIFSTINHLLFKLFAKFNINLLTAIVFNYLVCVVIGYNSSSENLFHVSILAENWFKFSVIQGALLAISFFLMGSTTKKNGVAITSLSTRLAVVIPVFAAFFLYDDKISATKMTGIFTALIALYLSSAVQANTQSVSKTKLFLPVFLFISFGLNSTLIKFVQEFFLRNASYSTYIMSSFFSALILSATVLIWRGIVLKFTFQWKDIISGVILGCSNYGGIYFLIKALSVPGWESSQLFPTISISIVILSSFGAWIFFKEKINLRMLLSLGIGIGSIILVNI